MYYIIINITYKGIDIQILHNNVYKHLSIYNLYVEKGCPYIKDTDVGACVVLSEDIPRLGIGTRPLNVLHAWPCTTKVIDR